MQDSNYQITGKFNGEAFIASLDAERVSRNLTWKKVAEQSKVPASTLTRMSQGKRPDIDSLTALCLWSGLKADDFFHRGGSNTTNASPLTQMTVLLRADPNLSKEGVRALEAIIKTAYEQMRK